MKNIENIILIFTLIMYFTLGCTPSLNYPDDIEEILNSAGKNRKELESVIAHYSKKPQDSLKLEATYFIIRNLLGLETLDTTSINNNIYYDVLDETLAKANRKKLNIFRVSTAIDSLNKVKVLTPTSSSAKYFKDLEVLDDKFLINNIDNAFLAWGRNPWSKKVSFNDFCEYILPYRCSEEYPQSDIRNYFISKYNSLLDSIKKSNNSLSASKYVVEAIDSSFKDGTAIFKRYPYLHPTKFSNLLKGRIGTCYDATIVKVTALRAFGIPSAIDQIPLWGNGGSNHFLNKTIDRVNDTAKITNSYYQTSTQHIISASSYDIPTKNEGSVPNLVQKHYIRTVPKVYRLCFGMQPNSLASIERYNNIPFYFSNNRLKDVTHEYLETSDISLKLTKLMPSEKYAYLCVFDNQSESWKPIAWSSVSEHNNTKFVNMGKNIVYLPAYYIEDEIVPAGSPFLLTENGSIKPIVAEKKHENVKLYTKYPYRTLVEDWQSTMVGCRIQLANKADFSDSITVYKIERTPFYQTDITINTNKTFRYVICQYSGLSDDGLSQMSIAELDFWGKKKDNSEIKLKGTLIGDSGAPMNEAIKINDGKRDTYFKNNKDSIHYIGIDLGDGNAIKVTKIRFLARNDDNSVVPDLSYELFYWQNKWVSLGQRKGAFDKTVTFKNVPQNALFLLKNIEGGVENRIFTYRNGVQLFW